MFITLRMQKNHSYHLHFFAYALKTFLYFSSSSLYALYYHLTNHTLSCVFCDALNAYSPSLSPDVSFVCTCASSLFFGHSKIATIHYHYHPLRHPFPHHNPLLDKEQKRVTWKQDIGRVNANDSKARVRHLEAVKARILTRRARTTKQLGRE
jgi:hypothetical protein